MKYPKITIVDENDSVIVYEDYPKAVAEGMIRRVSCIYVFDTQGKILLQKRSGNVRYPLLYECSASGHVDEGESYLQAAERELYEEIGLRGIPLQEVLLSYRTAECFNGIYKIIIPEETIITFDTYEVDSIRWVTTEEVDTMVAIHPPVCVDGFVQTWHDLRDTLIA